MNLLVLTPTLGRGSFLAETIRSVRALPARVQHLLICPADAETAMRTLAPGARVVAQSGSGLYVALNTGLAAAGDDWDAVTWINDDDVLCAEGVTTAMNWLETGPAIGVVYGRVGLMNDAGGRLGELPVARRPGDLPALLAGGIMPLAQPGTIIRGNVARQLGGFDAGYRLAGDLDYFVRALRAGAGFAFVSAEVARFRLRAGQLSKDEPAVAAEFARAVAGLPPGPFHAARRRFRWDNRWVYLERVRRHGFVRMQSLYRHG